MVLAAKNKYFLRKNWFFIEKQIFLRKTNKNQKKTKKPKVLMGNHSKTFEKTKENKKNQDFRQIMKWG